MGGDVHPPYPMVVGEHLLPSSRRGELLSPIDAIVGTVVAIMGGTHLCIYVFHNIGTVARAQQPALHDLTDGIRPGSNVLACSPPEITSIGDALRGREAIRSCMAEKVVITHVPAVVQGHLGQGTIPSQRRRGGKQLSTALASGRAGQIDLI